jgi:hypothetical protein
MPETMSDIAPGEALQAVDFDRYELVAIESPIWLRPKDPGVIHPDTRISF